MSSLFLSFTNTFYSKGYRKIFILQNSP